jgi:hypothetical protein
MFRPGIDDPKAWLDALFAEPWTDEQMKLAERALESLAARRDEDVEAWAARLGASLAEFDD